MSIRNAFPASLTLTLTLRPYADSEWKKLDCQGKVDNDTWFDAQLSFLDVPNDEVDNCRFGGNKHHLTSLILNLT